jgi:hypothetical protein
MRSELSYSWIYKTWRLWAWCKTRSTMLQSTTLFLKHRLPVIMYCLIFSKISSCTVLSRCVFLPLNTTELLKIITERIKNITEHLKVTTEHIFFITIQEFLISCWETKFYHKTSKNGRRTLLFYHNLHIFTELILTAKHFTATNWLDFYAEKQPFKQGFI